MEFEKQSFNDQQIHLDFNSFKECIFKKCTLTYHGYGPVALSGCEFHDVDWKFADSAEKVLNFMTGIYHGGGKDLIESTFANIRKGQHLTLN